jgi:hypothetical protein
LPVSLQMKTDYTDIVARFTDGVTAEKLANFIAAVGVPCDVVDIWDPVRAERFAIRVERSRITDLRQALDLKPVATRLSPAAAQILAGRLSRENVPCYVGGLHIPGPFGDFDVPISETTQSGFVGDQCMVAVPAKFTRTALRILNTAPISDAELTKLALADDANPENPPES